MLFLALFQVHRSPTTIALATELSGMSSLRATILCSAGTAALAIAATGTLKGLWRRMCIPRTVQLVGSGDVPVSTERSGGNTLVTMDWSKVFGKLPFKIPFCSGTLCDDGTIYIADTENSCIRAVDPNGIIDTFAGTCGERGFGGDFGPANEALLNRPFGVALDADGQVYISDTYNSVIRVVEPE